MPITQDRMLDLIQIADRCISTFEDMHSKLVRYQAELYTGKVEWQEAIETLIMLFNPQVVISPQDRAVLYMERRHFKSNAGRNASAAKWQANKRAKEQGRAIIPPKERRQRFDSNPLTGVVRHKRRTTTSQQPAVVNAGYDDEAEANRELAAMNQPLDFTTSPDPDITAKAQQELSNIDWDKMVEENAALTENAKNWEETKAKVERQLSEGKESEE